MGKKAKGQHGGVKDRREGSGGRDVQGVGWGGREEGEGTDGEPSTGDLQWLRDGSLGAGFFVCFSV